MTMWTVFPRFITNKTVQASKKAAVRGAGPDTTTSPLKFVPAPSKLNFLRLFKLVGCTLPVAAAGVGVVLAHEEYDTQCQGQALTGRITAPPTMPEVIPGLPSPIPVPVPPRPVQSPSLEVVIGITDLISDIEESQKESRMRVHIEDTLETKEPMNMLVTEVLQKTASLMKYECHEGKHPAEILSISLPIDLLEKENKPVLSSIQEIDSHPVILQQEECSMKPEIITTEDVSVEENNQMFSKESEAHIIQAQQTLAPESKPKGESNPLLRPDIGMLHGGKRHGPQDVGVTLMVAVPGAIHRAGVQAVARLGDAVKRLILS